MELEIWRFNRMFSRTFAMNYLPVALRPHPPTINREIQILKSKFQISVTSAVVLLNNQNFKNMFESAFCSYLQIIETVCQIKYLTL